MIVEKVFKCTLNRGYREIDSLITELAEEIEQGYHISDIIRIPPSISVNEIDREPDLIITLTKVRVL